MNSLHSIIQILYCTVHTFVSIRINERQQKKLSQEGVDEALLADAAAAVSKPSLPPNKKLAYMLDLKTIVVRTPRHATPRHSSSLMIRLNHKSSQV